jgi:dihydrofolate reductase
MTHETAVVHAWISMSLDGYIAGPNDRPGNPLGDGGERLHEWFFDAKGSDADMAHESLARSGAVVIGRRMFDHGEEPWGDDGAFGMPVFVVTHRPREPLTKGPTTFTFVTGGLEPALGLAREVAAGQDVAVAGGQIVMQCLREGLLDELRLDLVPIILGGGVTLSDGEGLDDAQLEPVEVVESPHVTHIRYRVSRGRSRTP